MKIKNYNKLTKCMEVYEEMYPKTYTTIEKIINILNNDYKECGGGGLFGIEVSTENTDRCYGFEFVSDDPYPVYEFVGMTKC